MSKKNRASTMTLKDFHGGSIPSDLQLPSAPGMSVDRGAYDRQPSNVWSSSSLNRGFDRGSGGGYHRQNGMRGGFEDRSSYFPNTATIGRSYDEDERRPAPAEQHRPRSSPAIETPHRSDPRPDPRVAHDNGGAGFRGSDYYSPYLGGRYGVQQSPAVPPRTPPERPSNAWAVRRGNENETPAGSPWRVRNNMARIAEASAIDKVSSGRWQPGAFSLERSRSSDCAKEVVYEESRKIETLQISHEPEFESGHSECYRVEYGGVRGYNEGGRVAMPGFEHSDSFRRLTEQRYADHEERFRNAGREEEKFRREEYNRGGGYDRLEVHDDGGRYYVDPGYTHRHADVKSVPVNRPVYDAGHSEAPYYERSVQQRKSSSEWDRSRTPDLDHQTSGQVPADSDKGVLHHSNPGERPKLKLLPKSKHVDEDAGEYNASEDAHLHDSITHIDAEHERPKLALKPRSQAADPVTGSERERQNLFGGARPRELVLKERGADDVMISGVEPTPTSCDQKERNGERQEGGRVVNRREHELMRSESERYDNRRDFGRQDRRDHHHHQQQQQQSPHQHQHQQQQEVKRDIDRQDSWRRPADPSPQSSPLAEIPSRPLGAPGSGPASSALQLAQAFSRPAGLSRSTTGSRLTDSASHRFSNNISRNNSNDNNNSSSSSNFIFNNSFKQPASSRAAW